MTVHDAMTLALYFAVMVTGMVAVIGLTVGTLLDITKPS